MTSVDSSWTLDKTLPSDLEAGHAVIDQLMAALEGAGWVGRDLFHIQMAIEEAVVNAIEHGNRREIAKQVHVLFHVFHDRAEMTITDQGNGFDHRNVADPTEEERLDKPRGRGVLLIRELMSDAKYNDKGNSVWMLKHRTIETEAIDSEPT
ncbi:MAG: ATP-binding protein [Planctomycetota bacterium]|jgi:serine/threonine-protein kinase RsbW